LAEPRENLEETIRFSLQGVGEVVRRGREKGRKKWKSENILSAMTERLRDEGGGLSEKSWLPGTLKPGIEGNLKAPKEEGRGTWTRKFCYVN